jgi:hypothetical protein
MRENKKLKRPLTFEENHRFEKRLKRRNNTIAQTEFYGGKQTGYIEKEEKDKLEAKSILSADRKKEKPDKKLATARLKDAFSFIPYNLSQYDKRQEIPSGYKPRSFNETRQYTDFLKQFIYPYKIPTILLFATMEDEYYIDEHGRKKKTQWAEIIRLSKKWICDIVSGQSFHFRNKEYFTKAESHIFLNTVIPYTGAAAVLETYFYAKCAARKIERKRCAVIARVFVEKFGSHFNHHAVTGFLDLLSRNADYRVDYGQLGDICDFVLAKVLNERDMIPAFTFSGRTMASVVALANEWHAQLQIEQEALKALADERERIDQDKLRQKYLARKWQGLPIPDFRFENDAGVWKVTQLRSVGQLLDEGRRMKNCVSSYSDKCERGESNIFNATCVLKESGATESKATLEVNASRFLIQAKAKCNAKVTRETMSVINRWAQANRIRVTVR